jgi:hypothetical protein
MKSQNGGNMCKHRTRTEVLGAVGVGLAGFGIGSIFGIVGAIIGCIVGGISGAEIALIQLNKHCTLNNLNDQQNQDPQMNEYQNQDPQMQYQDPQMQYQDPQMQYQNQDQNQYQDPQMQYPDQYPQNYQMQEYQPQNYQTQPIWIKKYLKYKVKYFKLKKELQLGN